MTKILIDARLYGVEHTGLGRYTQNVLSRLVFKLSSHKLGIILRKRYFETLKFPTNCEKILCDIPHYSLREQLYLPHISSVFKYELYYSFHFNVPFFINLPTIVTVHDLIKTYFSTPDTTTHSPALFSLKRFGYKQVISHAISSAVDIIVPTNTVKNQILSNYPKLQPHIIHPIPEAPDPIFTPKPTHEVSLDHLGFTIPTNYILFVGNAYPHKNLKVLLDAFRLLKDSALHLIIVSKRNQFLSRTLAPYEPRYIHVLSELNDLELVEIVRRAKVLITPSLMEGYGLVGLEAMMVKTPVIASNIPVYREVYGDKVVYFDPTQPTDLAQKISKLATSSLNPPLLKLDRTWDNVVEDIAEVINARCNRL